MRLGRVGEANLIMCSILRLMHTLCVRDVLLKMFLYMHVNEICKFDCVYMEQNCLEIFQGCFFSLLSRREFLCNF